MILGGFEPRVTNITTAKQILKTVRENLLEVGNGAYVSASVGKK